MKADLDKTLRELKSLLCVRVREILKKKYAKQAFCVYCKRRESEHLSDGRCDVYATLLKFSSEDDDEYEQIDEALLHIEELEKFA